MDSFHTHPQLRTPLCNKEVPVGTCTSGRVHVVFLPTSQSYTDILTECIVIIHLCRNQLGILWHSTLIKVQYSVGRVRISWIWKRPPGNACVHIACLLALSAGVQGIRLKWSECVWFKYHLDRIFLWGIWGILSLCTVRAMHCLLVHKALVTGDWR